MNRENSLINTLSLESDKFDALKALPKLRNLHEFYDVSAWDSAMNKTPLDHLEESLRKKNKSIDLSRKESLSPIIDFKFLTKQKKRLKNSPTPLAYKIATVALNGIENFERSKRLRKIADQYKLLDSNNKISSLYFPNKRRMIKKTENKRKSVPEISNILSLLKPDIRNPVKALIIPQLKSRTELYQSNSKRKFFSVLRTLVPRQKN